jgi:pimeloyl-ACP methyl ester carboxylesterase
MSITTDWQRADVSPNAGYEPLAALNRWWGELTPQFTPDGLTRDGFDAWKADLRAAVQRALGWTPEALPLAPAILAEGEWEPGIRFRFGEVATAPGLTVPFMLLVPDRLTGPAVLCLHGHGDGMNPLFCLNAAGEPVTDEYQHCFALEAARRGFVALTYDQFCFGRRRDFDFCAQYNTSACDTPTKLAQQLGGSMAGLRVFDARQMLTLLAGQPEVDTERLGVAGISGGGTITFYTTLLDDRVKAAMISGYFNQYKVFMQINHCIDNFVPGLARVAEMPTMGCAIAPRPLLISQGEDDPIFPLPATREGVQTLRQAYRLFDAEDRVEEEYYPGGHVFSNTRVWDFLGQWLSG